MHDYLSFQAYGSMAIDCLDLQWWFAIPRLGDHTMSAFYEIDTLALSAIHDLVAVGTPTLEQVPCVEIQMKEQSHERNASFTFARNLPGATS